ncbi:catechol 2,3-dioxygenase [Actinoplanes ianthinogenes]|uniref:Catechol 2,3-dioxygenase n=1 Tax=Actinoplanes ianthinogenes TaxID=122358 RepID=A0ABM7LNM2_9ACTN|nr:VOC family protein [Actinoplanes ianthinogenes]BCJ40849.1 catechol 2,3-dioxygenase [Actinoplanes ianthinogenes]GGR24793.1 catechol 2,3-dioxygenase [Actinoplanes ianthinogenes]
MAERARDIAHVSAVELYTPVLDDTVRFFTDQMAMEVVDRRGDSVYLHTWDDYERFSVKVTAAPTSGIGRSWLRARSPEALERRVAEIERSGCGEGWSGDEPAYGPVYHFTDPDGHRFGVYWETRRYVASDETRPSLKNQAARFPGRGANVRRLDHVNFLARDVPENETFAGETLSARPSEQIVLDDGTKAAVWYTFGDKSYDVVYTRDWTGSTGRLHHIAFATDTREDILRAADVFLEAGVHIETGPHKHAIQQTFFLYVYEPGGNRIELCNAGARLLLAPDHEVVTWTEAERAKGQAWGLRTIETFHTHGTPPVAESEWA